MRHRQKGRKLNRTWSHKKAMLRNMVTTFFDLEQIETTDAKAKEVRSLAERLITLSKRGTDDLAARRQAMRVVRSKKVVAKLFDELGPRYADRPGGYTRIVKVDERKGDGAQLSILQLVTEPVTFKDMKYKRAKQEEEAKRADEARRAKTAEGEEEAKGEEAEVEETAERATPEEVEEPAREPEAEPPTEEPPAEAGGGQGEGAKPVDSASAIGGDERPPSEGEPETPENKDT
jgi:large subunit ribosomal protein L17